MTNQAASVILASASLVVALAVCNTSLQGAPASPSGARPTWLASGMRNQSPHPSVVRIVAAERAASSQGSGTLISVQGNYGLVITNWHVIRDTTGEIMVIFPGGFYSPARVLKTDDDWDLAALLIWKPPVEPITLATLPPQPGDPLMIAGYGQGAYRVATGRCTQYVAPGVRMPYEMVEVSAEARQGDSGGPILNERGELAGVLFGASNGTTSGSYCGRIRWFLQPVLADIAASVSREAGLLVSTSRHLNQSPAPIPNTADASTTPPTLPPLATTSTTISSRPAPEAPSMSTPLPRRQPAVLSNSFTLADLFGDTPIENGKAILAIIGVLAIVGRLFASE